MGACGKAGETVEKCAACLSTGYYGFRWSHSIVLFRNRYFLLLQLLGFNLYKKFQKKFEKFQKISKKLRGFFLLIMATVFSGENFGLRAGEQIFISSRDSVFDSDPQSDNHSQKSGACHETL